MEGGILDINKVSISTSSEMKAGGISKRLNIELWQVSKNNNCKNTSLVFYEDLGLPNLDMGVPMLVLQWSTRTKGKTWRKEIAGERCW